MRMFKIGQPFKDVNDYASYSHKKLYYHGKLIGTSIVDNWQFRKIKNDIKNGYLLKAELDNGFKYWNVDVIIDYIESEQEFEHSLTVIARSWLEAKCKALLQIIELYGYTGDDDVDIMCNNIHCIEGENDD